MQGRTGEERQDARDWRRESDGRRETDGRRGEEDKKVPRTEDPPAAPGVLMECFIKA